MRHYKNTGDNEYGYGPNLKKMTKQEIMNERLEALALFAISVLAFQIAHYCLEYWEDAPRILWFGLDAWIGIPLFVIGFLAAIKFLKKILF